MSDSLLGNGFGGTDELPLPGAAIKHVDVFLETESGGEVSLGADYRRGAEFPLVVTTARLPWFDEDALGRLGRKGNQDIDWRNPPHVIFAGLSFLDRQRLTIDVDARRLLARALERQPARIDVDRQALPIQKRQPREDDVRRVPPVDVLIAFPS